MKQPTIPAIAIILTVAALPVPARSQETPLRRRATEAMHRATAFFTGHVATEGGYLWRYSDDLARREGEGKASDTTVWVQPPGTPSVGMAFLDAYRKTGDPQCLEAARQAGYCLVQGQLQSGGWDYRIHFDPGSTPRRSTTTPRRPPSAS